ncbi:MAG: uroporphyrinogen-III C-methyltransferase [Rhodobiaceae bacterium]|nr:uroporphyrinogen-III C-methyltransferase [Rhodobiaceae bacterium]MCC0052565.1 uroporphyrinogen-III C-methyltransferase [Rhodobiaceae bacterium]
MMSKGKVYLIGAGPGDPELLTLKAARLIKEADVIVYDRLVSSDILDLAPATAALLPVGKMPRSHPVPQRDINRLLVRLGGGGLTIVRLKGGDPLIFGRGGEEALALKEAGVPFEIVPGITAAQGCAASALVPLTHRGVATGVRYVTGHCRDDEPLDLDWASLADPDTTLVVYMGFSQIGEIAGHLVEHGLPASTPVAAIANGTCANQRVLRSSLATITQDVGAAGFSNPVAFVIGEVAGICLSPEADLQNRLRLVETACEAIHA